MIVPALLTNDKEKLKRMLDVCSTFADYVQIDIMDGEFVPSRSITVNDISELSSPIPSEAHLMAKDPLLWVEAFKKFGSKRVIFHFEIRKEHLAIVETIKKAKLEVGLAVNPSTQIKDFEFLVSKVDTILFMSVNPGFYGAKFIPDVLEKIKKFKEMYPAKLVGIDGGIKFDNVSKVAQSGVDYICIGSAILKESDSKKAYLKILNQLK
ncbi:MAG: ribulose-phosphate 3-epimerase [Candidatus Omnitrophota bacterium]|nr:ribulose-phosphate 3-epimerase [Candidatus Omnitrophota bacterium]